MTLFSWANSASPGKDSMKGGSSEGIALDRYQAIVDAHSSDDEMVDVWALDEESCPYASLDGYANPYTQAWIEEYERAEAEAEVFAALGFPVDPEELMDYQKIEADAYEYALDLAFAWYDGTKWVPLEVMEYAWYALSDHNY